MEDDPRRNDLRKEQRRRRFGPDAACVMCGETDPVAFHHVAGRSNDDSLESPLCLNCHAKVHEALRDAGVSLETRPRRTLPERIEAVLRALADESRRTMLEALSSGPATTSVHSPRLMSTQKPRCPTASRYLKRPFAE